MAVLTLPASSTVTVFPTCWSYVEYEPKHMQEQFRQVAESAVRSGRISVAERQEILRAFRESLQGYTYFEHH